MTRTCTPDTKTFISHTAPIPPCCPVSGNPLEGSSLTVSYAASAGLVLPVETLEEMAREYVGGFGSIRAMEEMIQHMQGRIEALVKAPVSVRADLIIAPPYGGQNQKMTVEVQPAPDVAHRLASLRKQHAEWSQVQFGDVSAIGPAKHLAKEALEVAADPSDVIEHADCWMLLWDMQRRAGITDEALAAAIDQKLAKNMARVWPEPKEGEAREHDRSKDQTTPDAMAERMAALVEAERDACAALVERIVAEAKKSMTPAQILLSRDEPKAVADALMAIAAAIRNRGKS